MRLQAVVGVLLLFEVRRAGAQAQTAIWKFPAQGEAIQANIIDTVLLDWTSSLPSTILRMWCLNGTDGDNFALASSFYVDSTGPFKYVMETYDPNPTAFPLSCHAELAANPSGSGFDSPAGIVWSSNSAQAAKTISQTQTAVSVTVTVVSTPPPGSTPTSGTAAPKTSAPPTSTTGTNPSQASTTASNTTISTKSSGSLSGATGASQISTSASASSNPNNTGAIIGGSIGGVALVSFISLALLFLRKHQRDGPSSLAMAPEHAKKGLYLFNVYKNRGPKARTTGIFEKEGDHGAYDEDGTRLSGGGQLQGKQGSRVSRWGQVHEVQGNTTWKKTLSRGVSWVGGRYAPVELPGDSSNFQ